jgi:hypothetical protein
MTETPHTKYILPQCGSNCSPRHLPVRLKRANIAPLVVKVPSFKAGCYNWIGVDEGRACSFAAPDIRQVNEGDKKREPFSYRFGECAT